MIHISQLTREFKNGKGIFDVTFDVNEGEVFGFIGPNGAGKSTAIRHLMGFLKPDKGTAFINGLDCWKDATEVKNLVGYLPGEISFIEGMSGTEFLKMLSEMRGMKDDKKQKKLIDLLEFDPKTPIHKMSKGMKQKVGIVAAFMHDPQVLILDEPTSGLDPLMQQRFVELILQEKAEGKTILMSSHIFTEMEKTCDRAAMIKDGRIILEDTIESIRTKRKQKCQVTLVNKDDIEKLRQFDVSSVTDNIIEIIVHHNWNELIQVLSQIDVRKLHSAEEDLEDVFLKYYQKEEVK
jgi:ABC-2 type transport system ATP-binding protein